jgi:DNA uptake protein ComE-like DNA-binding protein
MSHKKNTFLHAFLLYTRSQRLGIIILFSLIILLQVIYSTFKFSSPTVNDSEKAKWLSHQNEVDSLQQVDKVDKPVIYPFNPNFITDFKGYKLGMSTQEIDRLLAFRKQNKFVNSAKEFQEVTKVSDSLLEKIAPFFKFPDWVTNKKANFQSYKNTFASKEESIIVLDINTASKEELMKIKGIGDKISDRILEQKNKLGAFVNMEQMTDIWGLSPEVVQSLQRCFIVKNTSNAIKININKASIKELGQFPFFNFKLAKEIVKYRSMNNGITIDDLTKINDFPVEKTKIIALYLEF